MELALKIVIPIVGGLVLLFTVLKVIVSRVRRQLEVRMEERLRGRKVLRRDGWVSLFGQRSRGLVRVRGNGALALTDRELVFLLAVPAREITIPLQSVVSVSHPKSFMGRSIFRPLLVVACCGEEEDEVGWALKDPEAWGRAIDQARSQPDKDDV